MFEERVQLETSWKELLAVEFEQPYMKQLGEFLREEKEAGKVIYPPEQQRFAALNHTPINQVKVVIIGQDPYHGPGQAHGLSFSVQSGVRLPPSLRNMYKEIEAQFPDAGRSFERDRGCLVPWAKQGVLLLNAVLSVEQGNAGSHQKRGWETFTDAIVERLNREREGLVFLLWGSYAQKKGAQIDRKRHQVLESAHPSPLSARRGFFRNGHFRDANEYLKENGLEPIDWFEVE